MRIKYFLILLLVVSCFTWVPVRSVSALTASPVRLEMFGKPGQVVSGEVEFYNETRISRQYAIDLANFTADTDGARPLFKSTKENLALWIQTQYSSVSLLPDERKKVGFTINIPANAEPGGYFVGFLAKEIVAEADKNSVAVEGQVGTLLLLQVDGDFKRGASVLDFKTTQSVYSALPVDFSFRFQNEGASFVKPLGDIVVTNLFGKTSKIVPANPLGNVVLPHSIRKFFISWLDRVGEVQDYKPNILREPPHGFWNKAVYEYHNFALGRYRASLTLTYGDQKLQSRVSTVFWVLPSHLLLIASLILLLIIRPKKPFKHILKRIRR